MTKFTPVENCVVIYHANCDDGFGAAFAFWNFCVRPNNGWYAAEQVTFHPASYGEAPPAVTKSTRVYIFDFSYAPEVLIKLAEDAHSVLLMDHHKTAMEAWNKFWLIESDTDGAINVPDNLSVDFDMNRSGAQIVLDYVASDDTLDIFFSHLQDRDLWRFHDHNTHNFTEYLRSFPKDFETWQRIAYELNDPAQRDAIYQAGAAIKRRFDQMCAEIIGACGKEIWINGHKGLQANTNGIFASDVGNTLAKQSGTFGATWYSNRNGDVIFSLRSIGDFDVSDIAKTFGGGGHRNAAGFRVERSDFEKMSRIRSVGDPDAS